VAISNRDWIQFELLDPAGVPLGIAVMQSDSLSCQSFSSECTESIKNLNVWSEEKLGVELNAETIRSILVREPWPVRDMVQTIRTGDNRTIRFHYRPSTGSDQGSLQMTHWWNGLTINLQWIHRSLGDSSQFKTFRMDRTLPECDFKFMRE
jgi:hypothetical protein